MSIETRRSYSVMMKLIKRNLRKRFDGVSFNDPRPENWDRLRKDIVTQEKKRRKIRGTVTKLKEIADVPCEVTAATGCRNNGVILYIHGGSYILPAAAHHRMYAELLARKSKMPVVLPNYALAPDHPFPQGLDDCEKVYNALRQQRKNGRIILMGDSSGGGICLSLMLRLKKKDVKLPDFMVLHSPVTDLSGSIDRSINGDLNRDFILFKDSGTAVPDLYAGGCDLKNEEISPYHGDYEGFPPAFITCELTETLYADSYFTDKKLEEAGVPVRTIVMDGAFHTFATAGDFTIETRKITSEIIEFITQPIN